MLRIEIPIRTVSALNAREHFRARARRVKSERQAVQWIVNGKTPPALPCTVTMTRVGPTNGLDDDNLTSSAKGIRDQLAQWLGIDDRSPLVQWKCEQRRGKKWMVEVDIA